MKHISKNAEAAPAQAGTHTPTPWHRHDTELDSICGPDRRTIALVMGRSRSVGEDVANLQFILRACNSHAALLEALEAVTGPCDIETCDKCEGTGKQHKTEDACHQCGGCGEIVRHQYWPDDVRKARAAIALAKGDKPTPPQSPSQRALTLRSALMRLLACPDLNLDELESETREAIKEAWSALSLSKGDGQ